MKRVETGESSDDCLSKFFKVYLPGESGDDLVLPTSFHSSLPKSLPKTVTVRNIYGKIWKMALRKCVGDVDKYVLVNGWKRIVKEEDLNGGDFLTFEFDGSKCFNFCVYEGRTTCKRLRKGSDQINENKEENDGEEEEEEASDDTVIVIDDDSDVDVDYDCTNDNDAASDYADDNDDDDDDAFEDDNDDVEAVDVDDDEEDDRKYLDDRNNPSFPVAINPKKINQLRIPAHVIKDYSLNFPASITLIDPLAKRFGTLKRGIKIQENGTVFVNGFASVLRRNQVKLTDKMICELKKTGNNLVHEIKIYVSRG